jgi:SAM-dependent methyltransferase
MPADESVLSELDFGGWAEHYATRPGYGHFKEEVYPLFVQVLARLPSGARVLDLGAGPGHLAGEFYRAHPGSRLQFVLLDSSREMLRIAIERLPGRPVSTLVRSFNIDGWEQDLEPVHAIVSNNAIFCVRPERLDEFYRTCFGRLRGGGCLLNQQSFGFQDGESPYGAAPFPRLTRDWLPALFPERADLSPEEPQRLKREKQAAKEKHQQALAEAQARGIRIAPNQSAYHFLSVETHLAAMRRAGFAAGCMWRKREFAVVCGVKPG